MNRFILALSILLLGFLTLPAQSQDIERSPFQLEISNPSANPIEVAELSVSVEVIGNLATTTYDVLFFNPNDRVLEGSLDVSLADKQTVGRFALDINGALREAVAVEQEQGRVAFESIVRRNVDPALLEKTAGNNFRARVYPIPAKGNKRVVFAIEEILPYEEQALRYQLPLYFGETIKAFSMRVDVINQPMQPTWEGRTFSNFEFEQWNTHFVAEHSQRNFRGNRTLRFKIPRPASWQSVYVTPTGEGDYFFMVQMMPEARELQKVMPSAITILWDASASGRNRDIDREIEMLSAYFQKNTQVEVELIFFRDVIGERKRLRISGGDISELQRVLENVVYDGGTRGEFMNKVRWIGDEVWLFSDGLFTLGEPAELLKRPVYTIGSSHSADYDRLRSIAARGGGAYINLQQQSIDQAVATLTSAVFQYIKSDFPSRTLDEVYPASPQPISVGEIFTLTGRMSADQADVVLNFGVGGAITQEVRITLDTEYIVQELPLGRRWAYQKYQYLKEDEQRNEPTMLELAKSYTLITDLTSLIVLETVEDYVEHKIMPPAELRIEYWEMLRSQAKETEASRQENIRAVVNLYQDRVAWWNTDFPGWAKADYVGNGDADSVNYLIEEVEFEEIQAEPESPPVYETSESYGMVASDADESWGAEAEAMAGTGAPQQEGRAFSDSESNSTAAVGWRAEVQVQEWDPDREYLKRLKEAPLADRYSIYLTMRDSLQDSPGYYFDVALYFQSIGETALALRILSNLAEMKLESDELLRVLGHKYRQWEEYELAEVIFRKVVDLRTELPQSYRDLALVLTAQERYQEAAELYMHVIAEFDTNDLAAFPRIQELCLYELNHLRARMPKLNTPEIPEEGQSELPVDLRVVMTWNVTDVDIDLWLEDPFGERTGYSNTQSRLGARYTSDYTGGGLGPEEILLKSAEKGEYTITAHYYGSSAQRVLGPVTVQVAIYTRYGSGRETKEELSLQLANQEDDYLVGTFIYK